MKVLVVEDERKIASYLKKGLREHGYVVDVAGDGEDGLHLAMTENYDAVILDIMLPERDGLSVVSQLRRAGRDTPVLFLTACDAVEDRVRGLNLGADDYLVKPFAFSELLARLNSILRRGPSRPEVPLKLGDLKIDVARLRAFRGTKRLDLTPKEFALLSLLARHRGEVLSRTFIAERVWDMNFDGGTNVVDVHVRRLRGKLDEPFESKLLHTVRGVGYVLDDRR